MLPTETRFSFKDMKSEEMQEDIPCKWKLKENRSSYNYVRQNRLQAKVTKMIIIK